MNVTLCRKLQILQPFYSEELICQLNFAEGWQVQTMWVRASALFPDSNVWAIWLMHSRRHVILPAWATEQDKEEEGQRKSDFVSDHHLRVSVYLPDN